jgi:hypothetical protein
MVAVDAIVVYIQSTPNFPSWTSRVRSPSPALQHQQLGSHSSRSYRKITALSGTSIHHRRFELLNRFDPAFECRFRIHIQIYVECVPLLVRNNFRIDVTIAH